MGQFESDFAAVVDALPAASPLTSTGLRVFSPRRVCLVTIVGFEQRCLSAAAQLASLGWRADSVICVEYGQADMKTANTVHRASMLAHLAEISGREEPIWILHDDHDLTVDFGDSLLHALRSEGFGLDGKSEQIIFDISVGSSRLLLEGLHALMTGNTTLSLLYSEAPEYRPSFEEYLSYIEQRRHSHVSAPEFLTLGVDHVEVLRRFAGNSADDRPTYLAVIPSFTPVRIDAAIEELSPSRVHWVFGIPHLVRNRWRLDAQRDYHAHLLQAFHRHCYVSTFDYREILTVLESIYQKRRREYHLLICSLGSKMQKVGQVLFHLLRPEVGAAVSVPRIWDSERYSGDIPRAVYLLNLGDCGELRGDLWRTRTLRV